MGRGRARESVTSQSVDDLLSRIVSIAAHTTGARYAAIGVLGASDDRRLSTFITYGLTDAERAKMPSLPIGRGMLGVLIDHPAPVRVHDIEADPRAHGLPLWHPPMRTLLGVPIRANGVVFGNLYLTEKEEGADFTEQDEAIAVALAAAAGVAVENARLHEASVQRERWLSATTEVMFDLMEETDCRASHQALADHAREAASCDFAWVIGPADAGGPEILATSAAAEGAALSDPAPSDPALFASALGAVSNTDDPVLVEVAGIGPALAVPCPKDGVPQALVLGWRQERASKAAEVEVDLLAEYVEQACETLSLARGMEARQRRAVLQERDRISRDLHDFVIQRLFAVGLELKRSLRLMKQADVSHRFDEVIAEVDETIREIRRTVFDLGTDATSGDLQTEITRLVARAEASLKFRPTLAFAGPVRLRVPAELVPDVLAVLGEALVNVTRHAHARAVHILVMVAGNELILRVNDDGVGIAEGTPQSGLANLAARATNRGGEFSFRSKAPSGTLLEWRVPLP